MSTVTASDIRDFAERVERLCDFLLDGLEKDGSDDVVELQKIKKDAADLQSKNASVSIEGLSNHIRGVPITQK